MVNGGRWSELGINVPVRLAFLSLPAGMTEVPEQHEAGCTQVETVQCPDRSERQADDIDGIDQVAEIGEHNVAEAVGSEVFRPSRLHQHRQRAGNEDRR